jgi:PKD repeat protein
MWDFGDGSTSSDIVVNHTYQSVGNYLVTLTVWDNQGGSASTSQLVYISENVPPVVDFYWYPENATPGQWLEFLAYGYDPDGYIQYYMWDFGDGSMFYSNWNDAYHTYWVGGQYNVSLTVEDDRGATTTVTKILRVNLPPTAIIAAPETVKVGTPMKVSGAGSYDPEGYVAAYYWEFGDGGWAEGVNASHTYAIPGSYTVSLWVMDDMGSDAYTEISVSVVNPKAPVAIIGYSPYPITANSVCTFNGSSSVDPDGSISTYIWQFGDGSVGTGAQAQHSYRYTGQYEVKLVIIDEDGLSDSTSVTVNVEASKPKTTENPISNDPASDPTGDASTNIASNPVLTVPLTIGVLCAAVGFLSALIVWRTRRGR